MRVIAWSPHLTPERAEAAGVEFCASKEKLLETSDIVSIHIVLSESTVGLINAADFAKMKPTAFFINTSRGPLVDEAALVDALKERRIAGAGLDVFDIEPLPLDHPLRTLSNVTLTPHMGYVSDSNYEVCPIPSVLPISKYSALCALFRYFGATRWTTLPLFLQAVLSVF